MQVQPIRQPVQPSTLLPAGETAGELPVPAPEPEQTPLNIPLQAVVWGAGAGACFLYFALSYWRCRREFQTSLPVEGTSLSVGGARRSISLRQSDRISAPLTYGVLHPVILMPKNTNWNDKATLQYVLAHELVHIRRFDAATKLVLAGALCIHWFNPLVWVMYLLANRDLELSCDEEVVRQFGLNARRAYAMTLIGMEEQKSGLSGLYSYFNKNAMEERITAIMKTKKLTISAVCAALALIIGITAAFATSAMPGNQPDETAIPGFTQEESATLMSIWCDGDEELTVAQYRDKMLKLRDDPAAEALFQRLDAALSDHSLDDARKDNQALNEFLMFYTDLCKPLLFGDSYTFHFTHYGSTNGDAVSSSPWLECENQLTVLKPERLTVRTYHDARLDIFDSLGRVWDGTIQTIEAVELECQRLMEKWSNEMMTASVYAVVREGWEEDSLGDITQNWNQLLAPYLPFGLRFELNPRAALEGSGLRMTYQGYVVRGIVDGEIWITETAGSTHFNPDSIELFAVRDANGNLTGLRLPTEEENSQYWSKRVRNSFSRSPSSQFYEERRTVPGTKEDYETLFSSVKITGYKDLSLKEFNELVLNWGNKYFNAYESITEDTARSEFPMELSEEELEFLRLTMPLSQEENYRMIQSIKTGSPAEDPCVSAEQLDRNDGEWAWCHLWYQFSYHVADKNTMTVAERDRRVNGFMGEVRNFFQKTDFDALLQLNETDVVEKMQEFAKKYSGKQLTIAVDENLVQFESMDERDTHVSAENTAIRLVQAAAEAIRQTGDEAIAAELLGANYAQGLLWLDYDENWEVSSDGPYRLTAQGVPYAEPNTVRVAMEREDGSTLYEEIVTWETKPTQPETVPPETTQPETDEMIPARGRGGGPTGPWTSGYIRKSELELMLNDLDDPKSSGDGQITLYNEDGIVNGTFYVKKDVWEYEYNAKGELMASDGYKEYQDRPVYPVNSKGHTYGSDADWEDYGEHPYLVSAVGANGTSGYIRSHETDYYAESLADLPEQLAFYENMPEYVNLYDQEEENVLDIFFTYKHWPKIDYPPEYAQSGQKMLEYEKIYYTERGKTRFCKYEDCPYHIIKGWD